MNTVNAEHFEDVNGTTPGDEFRDNHEFRSCNDC